MKNRSDIARLHILQMAKNGTLVDFLNDNLKKHQSKKKINPFKKKFDKITFPTTIVLVRGINYNKPIFYMEGEPKVVIHPSEVDTFVCSMIDDGHYIHFRPN